MGTWDTSIKGNDITLDIYSNFFDLYDEGKNPSDVSDKIKDDFNEYFQDPDDRNNALFGLALAQWETKCLEEEVFNEVKSIIEEEADLELWKSLGADNKTVSKREKELNKFLNLISAERPRPKRRVKSKFEFTVKELVRVTAPDNKKEFGVKEEFRNQQYIHTGGLMKWFSGGGAGIMYYEGQGKLISIKWLDNQNLEIKHDKSIEFTKREERIFFGGDEVFITYVEE